MSDTQILTIVLATVPNILAVLAGILINNSRLGDLQGDMNMRLAELRSHMDVRFNAVDRRFDDMKDTWRSELHCVEEVLDVRLKHLEER
jgi:hypothetical protein